MRKPRGWTVHVEGRPSHRVDRSAWFGLIEGHAGSLTVPRTFDPAADNLTTYTVSLAISGAGRAIDTAIRLIRPVDPQFEVTCLEATTYEEEDRLDARSVTDKELHL